MEDLYLIHHGIKGQRWGVRRYQNADGSLTAAGNKRYNSMDNQKREYFKDKLTAKNTYKIEKAKIKANWKKAANKYANDPSDKYDRAADKYNADMKAAKEKYKKDKINAQNKYQAAKEKHEYDLRQAKRDYKIQNFTSGLDYSDMGNLNKKISKEGASNYTKSINQAHKAFEKMRELQVNNVNKYKVESGKRALHANSPVWKALSSTFEGTKGMQTRYGASAKEVEKTRSNLRTQSYTKLTNDIIDAFTPRK